MKEENIDMYVMYMYLHTNSIFKDIRYNIYEPKIGSY